jgi:hypothetical protein
VLLASYPSKKNVELEKNYMRLKAALYGTMVRVSPM